MVKIKTESMVKGRNISLCAIFFLLFSLISPICILQTNVYASGTTYLQTSFDSYPNTPSISGPTSEIGGNWGLYNYVNTPTYLDYGIGESLPGRTDRSIKLVSNTSGKYLNIQKTFTSGSYISAPKVVLDAKVYMNDTTHDRDAYALTSGNSKYLTAVSFDAGGALEIAGTVAGSYSANTLYNVLAIFDQANKKMDVYINGVLMRSNIAVDPLWDSIKAVKFGQAGNGTTEGWYYVDDVRVYGYIPVTGVSISGSTYVAVGESTTVSAIVTPTDATLPQVTWSSNAPQIATVDTNGNVTGVASGDVVITATTVDGGFTATQNIHVSPASYEYDQLRNKWKTVLTGGTNLQTQDPDIATKISDANSLAQTDWDTLDKSSNRTYLWADLTPSTTVSNWVNDSYIRVKELALAYSIVGGTLYQNSQLHDDIISAMDWLYANGYNENITVYGNGWNFNIGVPLRLSDLLVLMYDDLTAAQKANYLNALHHFQPITIDSSYTGANLADVVLTELIQAIVEKDEARITYLKGAIAPVFTYVTSGDGFYVDGSFIQHLCVPYVGSYGGVLLNDTANIFYILNGSSWQMSDSYTDTFCSWVDKSFAPLITEGGIMDMVRGRSIATTQWGAKTYLSGIINSLIRISQFVDPQRALHFKTLIKNWVNADSDFNYIVGILDGIPYGLSFYEITEFKDIMADASVPVTGQESAHYEFNSMATVVQDVYAATWYTAKVIINIPQQKYDVYVNGVLKLSAVPFRNTATQVDTVYFVSGYAGTSSLYIDDVTVPVYGGVALALDYFDEQATGTKPIGWTVADVTSNAPVTIAEIPNSENKSVYLNDNSSTFSDSIKKTFTAQSGKFYAEWKFMEDDSGKWPGFVLNSGSTTAILLSSNGTLKYTAPDNSKIDIVKVAATKWHMVKLAVDVTAKTYDVWVDGVLYNTGLAFKTNVSNINTLEFYTSYGAVSAGLCIDEVKVYNIAQ